MRTRISKHGKYRIYEGVEREVGDMLQPEDLLTTIISDSGEKATFEVRARVRDHVQFNANKHLLNPLVLSSILFSMASDFDGDFFTNRNAYLVLDSEGSYMIWWPLENGHRPVKIKRRITEDTGIVADTVIAGDIHADRINGAKKVEEAAPQVPTEPGLYRDRIDDYVLFHRVCGSGKLYYTNLTCGEKLNGLPRAYEVEDDYNVLQNYAPYTRVTYIKDVEVAP